MVKAAWAQLATPFKLGSRKPDASPQSALNCIGLVVWAAAQAGIALDSVPVGGVLVPDDILTAANARIIFEWHDDDGPDAPPPTAPLPPASRSPLTPSRGLATVAMLEPAAPDEAVAATMVRSELFLGLSRKDGNPIADAEVSAFVDEEVIPRFPAGTTQVSASGTYGSQAAGVIHEASRLLTVLHPNDPTSRARIQELAAIYRKRFQQEMVLIAMSPALVFSVAA
jgi:hypothetical protein